MITTLKKYGLIQMAIEPIEYMKERDEWMRRPTENSKIKAATKHFAAVGIDDYAKSSPEGWNL